MAKGPETFNDDEIQALADELEEQIDSELTGNKNDVIRIPLNRDPIPQAVVEELRRRYVSAGWKDLALAKTRYLGDATVVLSRVMPNQHR